MFPINSTRKIDRHGRSLNFENLESRIALDASMLRVTEFMASNDDTLDDYDGDSSDWVEIYNAGTDEVDLSGMYLTDKGDNLTKWAFPSGSTIAGGEYKVVFASNKDTVKPNGEVHTSFALGAGGEYLGLIDVDGSTIVDQFSPEYPVQFTDVSYGVAEIATTSTMLIDSSTEVQTFVPTDDSLGTSWTEIGFVPDGSWTSGSTMGVGYDNNPTYLPLIDTDVGAQMFSENSSAYIRVPFNHTSANSENLTLRIKYDDGFAAYLNGQPILSRNAPANPSWNSSAPLDRIDATAIEDEVIDLSAYAELLLDGSNVLAIHGLNVVSTSSDFLIDASLEVSQTTLGSDRYFVDPSPGASNFAASLNTAPFLSELSHGGGMVANNQDIVVTTMAVPQGAAINEVRLHYRIMFGSEASTFMFDDGLHGDEDAGDGIFGASISHTLSDPGEMVRYYVTAMDANGGSSRFPFFQNTEATEYAGTVIADPGVSSLLPIYQWFVEDPTWFQNGNGTNNYDEQSASVFLNGELYDNVIVNTKGRISGQDVTPKIEFTAASDKEFVYANEEESVKKFDLGSIYQDPSASRVTLGFEFFREAGSNAPLAYPVHTRLNGQFYRLSIFVERINKPFLERTGLDREGAVYKADGVYAANNTSLLPGADIGTTAGMEKTNRDDLDPSFSDLEDLIAGVSPTNPNRQQYLLDNVDLPEFFNTLAMYTITKHYDSATHNYYVYRDSDGDGLWRMIPWDVDLIWDRLYEPVFGRFFSGHPFIGSSSEPSWSSDHWNKLIDAVVDSPLTQQLYLRRLRTLMDQILQAPGTPLANRVLENRVDDLVATLAVEANATITAWGTRTDAFGWGNITTLSQGVTHLKNRFDDRRDYLYSLGIVPSAQPVVTNLTIGDFEADPVSGNQGEEYIEIVNPNNFAVDISGWSLANAVEHTFVPGSVIPAQGSLYVVRDLIDFRARTTGPSTGQGLVIQGNYKGGLSTTGETLELRNEFDVIIDTEDIPAYSGDYDGDGDVDGRDFLAWQRSFGASVTPIGSGADGDHSGMVDAEDLQLWSDTYGTETSLPIGEPLSTVSASSEQESGTSLFSSGNLWLTPDLLALNVESEVEGSELQEVVFDFWESAPKLATTNPPTEGFRASSLSETSHREDEQSEEHLLELDEVFSEIGV